MVSRTQCPELTREARAHEDLHSPTGRLFNGCVTLVAAGVALTGVLSCITPRWPLWPAAAEPGSGPGEGQAYGSSSTTHSQLGAPPPGSAYGAYGATPSYGGAYGSGAYGSRSDPFYQPLGGPGAREESNNLGLDFDLVAIFVAVVAICIVPLASRSFSSLPSMQTPWTQWQQCNAQPPWGQSQGSAQPRPMGLDTGNPFCADPLLNQGAARGRVIDVKLGEHRGGGDAFGGGPFGSCQGLPNPGGMDWTQPQQNLAGGGGWTSPVPTPWGAAAPAAPGLGGQTVASLGSSIGAWLGFGAGQAHVHGALPTEAEVTETYANFGVELQAWGPAMATIIERDVIDPLLRHLDESDLVWQRELAPKGWRLTSEAPRLAYGLSPTTSQELSVFDRHLPRPFCQEPRAVELWAQRQKLEAYLLHPCFEPGQRNYVLERLREWRQMGLLRSMKYQARSGDLMPTDAHILENLIMKLLNFTLDFANCFLSRGQAPPQAKFGGQPAHAYLRQVTDQGAFPRPAPHYEVVTMQKTWKFKPGSTNMLEAVALLLHALRRHSPSYTSFPQALRAVVEAVPQGPVGSTRAAPWF